MQCIKVSFNGQISPSTLCGSSTQYHPNKITGPASAESLVKYEKFDIMESIHPFSRFLALSGQPSYQFHGETHTTKSPPLLDKIIWIDEVITSILIPSYEQYST